MPGPITYLQPGQIVQLPGWRLTFDPEGPDSFLRLSRNCRAMVRGAIEIYSSARRTTLSRQVVKYPRISLPRPAISPRCQRAS